MNLSATEIVLGALTDAWGSHATTADRIVEALTNAGHLQEQ